MIRYNVKERSIIMEYYNKKNTKTKKSLKKLLIYFLTVCLSMTGCSLSKKKDSINKVLKTIEYETTEDTTQVETIEKMVIQESTEEVVVEQPLPETNENQEDADLVKDNQEVELEKTNCDEEINQYEELNNSNINETEEQIEEQLNTDSISDLEVLPPVLPETSNKKLVALTFDDGPSRYTSELVKILEENDASATFFLIGSSIKNYPDAVKEAYLSGNEIAIHTYSHKYFTKMTIEQIIEEIEMTEQLINDLDVECADLVRPPYGSISKKIIENIDTSFILWNVDTRDWESRDKEAIKKEVEVAIKEGAIILFHDTYQCTIDAIKEILPAYSEEYEFVTVTELFERNQKKLEDNQKYYSLTK